MQQVALQMLATEGVKDESDVAAKLNRADIEHLLTLDGGPVDWSQERSKSQKRDGLGLWGADLRGLDLSWLSLARLNLGMNWKWWKAANEWQRTKAAANLQNANLWGAELQGAKCRKARFDGATLAHVNFTQTQILFCSFVGADMHGAILDQAEMDGCILTDASGIGPRLLDVVWKDVDLTRVEWFGLGRLLDEMPAPQASQSKERRMAALENADRTYLQLTGVLKAQLLDGPSDALSYRRMIVKRFLLYDQGKYGRWLLSYLQWLLSGYTFYPWRAVVVVVGYVLLFGLIYWHWGGVSLGEGLFNSLMVVFGQTFYIPTIPHTQFLLLVNAIQIVVGIGLLPFLWQVFSKLFSGR